MISLSLVSTILWNDNNQTRTVPWLGNWIFLLCFNAEVVENEEEECDTDLERQNVEELYDYVRHLHQRESQEVTYDVQHKALIPVLRPYQSQAVNWMLRREQSRNSTAKGSHFLCGTQCPECSIQFLHFLSNAETKRKME